MYSKEIVYDRQTRDYTMLLDGELVGFARTYHEAEVTLDQLVCELLGEQPVVEAPAEVVEVFARPAEPVPEAIYQPMHRTLHPDLNVFACPGGLFDVHSPELEANIGRQVRFVAPSCGVEHGLFQIIGIQRIYTGALAYRVQCIDMVDPVGRPALPDAIIFVPDTAPVVHARPAEAVESVCVPVVATRVVTAGWSADNHDDLAAIAAQLLLPLAHLRPYINARGDYVGLGRYTEIPAPCDDHAIVVCLIDALNEVAAQLPVRPDSITAHLHIDDQYYMVGHNGPPLLPVVTYARPAEVAEPIYVAPTDRLDHAVKTDLAATFAASPSLMDATITGALETYTDEAQRLLDQALAQKPLDKDEAAYWRAQRNAFAKALHYFSAEGVRLNPTPNGGYTVPSASRAGAVIHRLWKVGGVWHCSCEAGERGILHWHTALIAGYDRALDLLELEGDDGEVEQEPPAAWNGYTDPETGYDADDYADEAETPPATALGQRLAWARAQAEIGELFA